MRITLSVFAFMPVLLFAMSAMAQNKVVVIPLNSSQRTTCTAPDEVLSAGQCWKDRNLGASRVATSSTDTAAYGDMYQWGRPRDGHQHRTSALTAINSDYDDPEHGDFITESSSPYDWRVPQNDNLWQGLGGVNNPCPQGFRLPTKAEWEIEQASWSSNDAAGAFASPLKLVLAGFRNSTPVSDNHGYYWSSTKNGIFAWFLTFYSSAVTMDSSNRAYGFSVRCLKD